MVAWICAPREPDCRAAYKRNAGRHLPFVEEATALLTDPGLQAHTIRRSGRRLTYRSGHRVFETQEKRAALSDTPRIAIVDDDEMVSEATGELIRTYGLAARTFASAEAFLGSDCVTRTSRLVADIQMAGANGLQLHRHFTRAGHRIPVIFITTFPDEALRKRALNAGATCYLSKPFNPALLLNCIRVAIGPWKPGREA